MGEDAAEIATTQAAPAAQAAPASWVPTTSAPPPQVVIKNAVDELVLKLVVSDEQGGILNEQCHVATHERNVAVEEFDVLREQVHSLQQRLVLEQSMMREMRTQAQDFVIALSPRGRGRGRPRGKRRGST